MLLRAVVFDFDGTLARPSLDFTLMKQRIARLAGGFPQHVQEEARELPSGLPALEWIDAIAGSLGSSSGAAFHMQAHALIAEMEREAASRTSLFPFTRQLLRALEARGTAVGIITRNNRAAVDAVFPDVLSFARLVLTREDVAAVKPDPAHLLAALDLLGARPEASLMVGDHPTDVQTARRAGTAAAAVASGGTSLEALQEAEPDLLMPDAGELLELLAARGWINAGRFNGG